MSDNDGVPEHKMVSLAQSVAALKQALPAMLEIAVVEATLKHARYRSLIAAGFDKDQALELVKHWKTV